MTTLNLPQLGWRAFFQQQLTLEDLEQNTIARVMEHHRSEYLLMTDQGLQSLSITPNMPPMTVGDWLLLDKENRFARALERSSVFSRKAAGSKLDSQLISANVDTVFVVCSLNSNFNLSRIERYLALANEAGVEPVVVLTKADTCEHPEDYIQQVQKLDAMLMVEAVNALDKDSVAVLASWCKTGQSVAFMGSSGVGKSTLINTAMLHLGVESNIVPVFLQLLVIKAQSTCLKRAQNASFFPEFEFFMRTMVSKKQFNPLMQHSRSTHWQAVKNRKQAVSVKQTVKADIRPHHDH